MSNGWGGKERFKTDWRLVTSVRTEKSIFPSLHKAAVNYLIISEPSVITEYYLVLAETLLHQK